MATEKFSLISDEALQDLRTRVGKPVRAPDPWLTEASLDSIRHYAWGIGDRNPLFLDEEYAARSPCGTVIAPPTILFAFDRVASGYVGGLPGVHAMYAGTHFRFRRPVKRGDRVRGESVLKDLIERPSRFSGRAIQQIYTTRFVDGNRQEVATADSWCFRTQRDQARSLKKYERIIPHQYTQEELDRIWQEYEQEEIRGGTPRYFDDVQVGEELPPVIKGPLTATGVIAYAQGWGGLYIHAHRYARDLYRGHPALAIPNPLNVPEPPERVHWDSDFAQRVGAPFAYDYGPERVSWLGHVMTNWISDYGFLSELRVEVRRFNILGDTHWCRGRVAKVQVEDQEHGRVQCELWAIDQRGEITAKGMAEAILPRRRISS